MENYIIGVNKPKVTYWFYIGISIIKYKYFLVIWHFLLGKVVNHICAFEQMLPLHFSDINHTDATPSFFH